ncbi:hypothetical protein KCP75_22125 [Salmonella enterica subsp. enterica]|nr:hypothetical protein KCP75_22125 [Salmonella enterica subsp. enterica]
MIFRHTGRRALTGRDYQQFSSTTYAKIVDGLLRRNDGRVRRQPCSLKVAVSGWRRWREAGCDALVSTGRQISPMRRRVGHKNGAAGQYGSSRAVCAAGTDRTGSDYTCWFRSGRKERLWRTGVQSG